MSFNPPPIRNDHYRLIGGLMILAAMAIVACITGCWVLTAIPIGLLFGFALHKGDLCTAAACSEVVLFREGGRWFGIWIAVVVSMAGFALLDLMDWIVLAPQELYWANNLIGGALFGIGMVLAGGCVSGCLFKSAAGNLNSMAGLLGLTLGAVLAEQDVVRKLNARLMEFHLQSTQGEALTWSNSLGIPQHLSALVLLLLTLVFIFRYRHRKRILSPSKEIPAAGRSSRILRGAWKPWQAGLIVGLLAIAAYPSSSASGRLYPLGVTSGVIQTRRLITGEPVEMVCSLQDLEQAQSASGDDAARNRVEVWEVILVLSLLSGALVSGRLSKTRLLPKPWGQVVVAFLGGNLLAMGAAIGFGCTIGHIISGWAMQSMGSLVFAVAMILTSWVTTYFYLLGGSIRKS